MATHNSLFSEKDVTRRDDAIAVAVQLGLTVNALAATFTIYPSISGSVTEAARQLMHHDDLD